MIIFFQGISVSMTSFIAKHMPGLLKLRKMSVKGSQWIHNRSVHVFTKQIKNLTIFIHPIFFIEGLTRVFSNVKIGNITGVKTWFFHVKFQVSFDFIFGSMGFCDFRTNNPQNSCLVEWLLTWNVTSHNMELEIISNLHCDFAVMIPQTCL